MLQKHSLTLLLLVGLAAGCSHQKGSGDADLGGGGADLSAGADLSSGGGTDFATSSNSDAGTMCSTGVSCVTANANCGPIGDGCGGTIDCGTCTGNQTCGGGGVPSQCGTMCVPTTCPQLGYNCGTQSDGCGGTIDCGTCTGGDTCGGGGMPSVCGQTATCVPTTCNALGYNCGPAGDGCGNTLQCGTCTGTDTCGGNGVPSQCGTKPCVPATCSSLGLDCGPAADGCGGILQCGTCSQPMTCGGTSKANVCGTPASCTGLCLQQTTCSNPAVTTTVSGVVYAPNGTDPLPNVLVYVPNSAVTAFAPGVSCGNCEASVSGSPLVSTVTDYKGTFTLSNMPVGSNIPLVIQTGRWRRQVVIPSVASCTNTVVAATLTHLPTSQAQGDIPHMAFVTGAVDALECVMRKIGVADSEFTKPSGTGRIHMYVGDSGNNAAGGATAGNNTPSETTLVASQTTLNQYDMILFPCKGAELDRTSAELNRLVAYANAGGRVFTTHYSYDWLFKVAPFSSVATWDVSKSVPNDQTGYIDQTFTKGATLANWLKYIGASTTLGQIALQVLRQDTDSANATYSQTWMTIKNPAIPMHFTFDTPVGTPAAQQCGRVLFDDFHVEDTSTNPTTGEAFPTECTTAKMTAQEKLLEFMIFDLGSCVGTSTATCTPATCASEGIGCGQAGDGCGNVIDCGACPSGQTCGGGGTPSQCGAPTCTKTSCSALGFNCGTAGDGCGGSLDCGTCPSGQTCGGGGKSGVCGSGTCTPTTCAAQGYNCGPAGDGCGGTLQCGACPSGQTCGGGGKSGVCGAPACTPKTCAQLGYNCGAAADGCGATINCGTCTSPATCGGGGMANVCGGGIIQ